MKWLSRLRLPKSFPEPIQRAKAKKELTPCLLFAQQPNPAGRQEKRCKSVGHGGIGWKARAWIQMGLKEVTLLIRFPMFCRLCLSTDPPFYILTLPTRTNFLSV